MMSSSPSSTFRFLSSPFGSLMAAILDSICSWAFSNRSFLGCGTEGVVSLGAIDRRGMGFTGRVGSKGRSARRIISSRTLKVTDGRGVTFPLSESSARVSASIFFSSSSSVAVLISSSDFSDRYTAGIGGTGGGKLSEGRNDQPLARGVPNSNRPSKLLDLVGVPSSVPLKRRATSRAGVPTPPSTTKSNEVWKAGSMGVSPAIQAEEEAVA